MASRRRPDFYGGKTMIEAIVGVLVFLFIITIGREEP